MFLALALASIAHADATFADASVSAESPSDGTCTISLELTSDDHLYVFDANAGSYSFSTIRWYLVDDGDPCQLADIGTVFYEICGDADVDADDNLVWTVSFDADEGTSGTWDVTDATPFLGEATTLASVDWSCGSCDLEADITGDGKVDWQDYIALAGYLGQAVAPDNEADLTGDGIVNTADLLVLLGEWGLSC